VCLRVLTHGWPACAGSLHESNAILHKALLTDWKVACRSGGVEKLIVTQATAAAGVGGSEAGSRPHSRGSGTGSRPHSRSSHGLVKRGESKHVAHDPVADGHGGSPAAAWAAADNKAAADHPFPNGFMASASGAAAASASHDPVAEVVDVLCEHARELCMPQLLPTVAPATRLTARAALMRLASLAQSPSSRSRTAIAPPSRAF
jgi:hypothetical protein